jgi:hypothetical protein
MDYEKKYLKYKSKYNLKKSSLLGGGVLEDAVGNLVLRNVPMIRSDSIYIKLYDNKVTVFYVANFSESQITWREMESGLETSNKSVYISDEWKPYIKFDKQSHAQRFTNINLSFKEGINPTTQTKDKETLLYLAAQNCNKIMFDALVAMGADPDILNIGNKSNILHGIAWGSIKTYDEKVAFIQEILGNYPKTIPFLFHTNDRGKTFYDNLLIQHPNKISKSLEDVAFPIGWVKRRDAAGITYYENTSTSAKQWNRPY